MGDREIKKGGDFLRRPCIKQAPSGWYKSELATFCSVNNVPNCNPVKDSKSKLCKAIASYFDAQSKVVDNDDKKIAKRIFASKRCDSSRTGWRVADLKAMALRFGLPNIHSKKSELCAQLSEFFNTAADISDINNLSTPELRRLCIDRKIRGCKQTKKRETFLKKLDVVAPPPRADSLSIGEKPVYYGKFVDTIVNDGIANLSALLYLLQTYRDVVCLPIRPSDLRKGEFLLQDNCEANKCCCMTKRNLPCGNKSIDSHFCWQHKENCQSALKKDSLIYKERQCGLPPALSDLPPRRSVPRRITPTRRLLKRKLPDTPAKNDVEFIFDALRDKKICSNRCALSAEAIVWLIHHPGRPPTYQELHPLKGVLASEAKVVKEYLNILASTGAVSHVKAKKGYAIQGWNNDLFDDNEDLYWKSKKTVNGKIIKIKNCDCSPLI